MPIVTFDMSLPAAGNPRSVAIATSTPLSQSDTLTTVPAAWEGLAIVTPMAKAAIGRNGQIENSLPIKLRLNMIELLFDQTDASRISLRIMKGIDPNQWMI
jgi:hypothetical protein